MLSPSLPPASGQVRTSHGQRAKARELQDAFGLPPAHAFGIKARAETSVLGGRRSDVAIGWLLASHVWSLNRPVGGRGKPNFPQPAMFQRC